MNIRHFVRLLLSFGFDAEEAWAGTQAAFPGRLVTWSYVSRIAREWNREQATEH